MQGPVAIERKPRQKERGPVYGPEVRAAVALIAQALDYPSAERLQPVLVPMASLLAQHGLLTADDSLLAQLERISLSTVRRILDGTGRDKPRPLAQTRRQPAALLRDIPAGRIPWDIGRPGASLWPQRFRGICLHGASRRCRDGLGRTSRRPGPQLSGDPGCIASRF